MKFGLLLATTIVGLFGFWAVPSSASSLSCVGYVGGGQDVTFGAFAGHNVRASYSWCIQRRPGFIGPVQPMLRSVSGVHVSFPSRFPGSWGEDVRLADGPYLYSASTSASAVWKYRFSVDQHVVQIFGVNFSPGTNWDFELQVAPTAYGAKARICFVHQACSSWQS